MSVYYFEGAQILAPFSITSNEPRYEVDTISLSKQRASQGVQRWELNFRTIGTADTQVEILIGSVTNLDSTSTMVMPQLPAVDAAFTASSNSIPPTLPEQAGVSSLTMNTTGVTGIIPRGAFFKFSNSDKIYVTTSATDMSLPNASFNFYPTLRKAITISDNIMLGSNAVITYYRDIDNQQGITFMDGVLSDAGNITLIEAV